MHVHGAQARCSGTVLGRGACPLSTDMVLGPGTQTQCSGTVLERGACTWCTSTVQTYGAWSRHMCAVHGPCTTLDEGIPWHSTLTQCPAPPHPLQLISLPETTGVCLRGSHGKGTAGLHTFPSLYFPFFPFAFCWVSLVLLFSFGFL